MIRLSCFIILALLCGCAGNECNLHFSLPQDFSNHLSVMHYASDKRRGVMIESVATVMNGKGELRLPIHNPTILYLNAGGKIPTVIYAERGDNIDISGPESNPALWTIGGNPINEELTLWRNAHATTLFSGTPQEINEAVADYVERHPDDQVSSILLLTAYSRTDNENEFVDLWYALGPKADKEKWINIVGRSDMLHNNVRHPGRLVSMAMRSLANGVDTVKTNDVKATILLFWINGMDNRKTLIDSLKVLSKEFPDSASRIIADVSVDADSISWRSPLRNDSVKNIARFWVPAGLADTRLIALQVTRTPFFMVVAPGGKQTYRGSDPSAALKEFRRVVSLKRDSVSGK